MPTGYRFSTSRRRSRTTTLTARSAYIKRFWFDTALSGDAVPLAGLTAVADPSRILFGTDYPYISPDVVTGETRGFDAWDGFTDAQRAAVNRGNAETMFPRFAG